MFSDLIRMILIEFLVYNDCFRDCNLSMLIWCFGLIWGVVCVVGFGVFVVGAYFVCVFWWLGVSVGGGWWLGGVLVGVVGCGWGVVGWWLCVFLFGCCVWFLCVFFVWVVCGCVLGVCVAWGVGVGVCWGVCC